MNLTSEQVKLLIEAIEDLGTFRKSEEEVFIYIKEQGLFEDELNEQGLYEDELNLLIALKDQQKGAN